MKVTGYHTVNFSKDYKKLEENYRTQRKAELERTFQTPEYWQILQRVNMNKGENIGSITLKKTQGKEVPASIIVKKLTPAETNPITTYDILYNGTKAGFIKLEERPNGAYIALVENKNPEKYGGMLKLCDRLAVENCLKRGLKDFQITGDAVWNSHAVHYLAGKRFYPQTNTDHAEVLKRKYGTTNINKIIKEIIETTPKNTKYFTHMRGSCGMYMPKNVIEKYIKLAKACPILK